MLMTNKTYQVPHVLGSRLGIVRVGGRGGGRVPLCRHVLVLVLLLADRVRRCQEVLAQSLTRYHINCRLTGGGVIKVKL